MLNIAVAYKTANNIPEYRQWLEKARLESAGLVRIQNAIREALDGAEGMTPLCHRFPAASSQLAMRYTGPEGAGPDGAALACLHLI